MQKLSNLSKVAQLINEGARIHAHDDRLQDPHSLSLSSFIFVSSIANTMPDIQQTCCLMTLNGIILALSLLAMWPINYLISLRRFPHRI